MKKLPGLQECTGFDEHNAQKNWEKHQVTVLECEQVFFNLPLIVAQDVKHSQKEAQLYVLGHTNAGRRLFVVFTTRGRLIRVISARDMSRKEKQVYDADKE